MPELKYQPPEGVGSCGGKLLKVLHLCAAYCFLFGDELIESW
jgi:hypothetical protein